MEAQIGWGMAMVLMALVAAHAAEEILSEGRIPGTQGLGAAVLLQAWAGERIGPLLLLVALALSGVLLGAFWIWLALGIALADLARHAYRSIQGRESTPCSATGVFPAVYALAFVGGSLAAPSWAGPSPWGALAVGIACVAIGYLCTQKGRPLAPQRAALEP
jgi:hypothetical protein